MTSTKTSKYLLQGGVLLLHDENEHVTWKKSDLLIEGSVTAEIGDSLDASRDVKVINCHGKIVSPGFVDTHHHVWQTALKGSHGDDTLLDYFPSGNQGLSLQCFALDELTDQKAISRAPCMILKMSSGASSPVRLSASMLAQRQWWIMLTSTTLEENSKS